MNEQQLQRMADRGTPIGAVALLARVEDNLPAPGPASSPPRWQKGPAWGLAVFVVIVLVGVGMRWLVPLAGEAIGTDGIDWRRAELPGQQASTIGEAAAGPGGFLVVPLLSRPGANLWHSGDARAWEPVEIPGMEFGAVVAMAATADRWVVLSDSNLAWSSTDGVTWEAVTFPEAIAETVVDVVATSDWFLAVSTNVFDSGTTVWRSRDASSWEQLESGPLVQGAGDLIGTPGGFVWLGSREGASAEMAISNDGVEWNDASLTVPDELGAVRVFVRAVRFLGERWVALVETTRSDGPPVVTSFVSDDGATWTYEGIPPFGEVEDAAAGVWTHGIVGDHLVVVGSVTPVTTFEGSLVASGSVRGRREAWSTTDGIAWSRAFRTGDSIEAVGGGLVGDRLVGFWVKEWENTRSPAGPDTPIDPVVTTAPQVDAGDLDPEGSALQDRILEDGTVTREEAVEAMEGWKKCMEDRGVTHVEYEFQPDGGQYKSYASPSPSGALEDAIDRVCDVSWSERVFEQLLTQN